MRMLNVRHNNFRKYVNNAVAIMKHTMKNKKISTNKSCMRCTGTHLDGECREAFTSIFHVESQV